MNAIAHRVVYTGNGNEKMWVGGYQEGQTPNDLYAFVAKGFYPPAPPGPRNIEDRRASCRERV